MILPLDGAVALYISCKIECAVSNRDMVVCNLSIHEYPACRDGTLTPLAKVHVPVLSVLPDWPETWCLVFPHFVTVSRWFGPENIGILILLANASSLSEGVAT